jgi:hypothetical protein
MTALDYRCGYIQSRIPGTNLATVLVVSTMHQPDLFADLSVYDWGRDPDMGTQWFYAYEEKYDEDMPDWLMQICITARNKYGANWVLMDPDGDEFPDDFPIYDHL